MKGRTLALSLLGLLVLTIGMVFWLGVTGGGTAASPAPAPAPAASNERGRGEGAALDGSVDGTAADRLRENRRVRDEVRRRILQDWAKGEDERARAARAGKIPSMPLDADGGIDRSYIQGVFRDQMMPMIESCYEELVARRPDAGGRIDLAFQIVGDDGVGGIVEAAEIDGGAAGAFGDERLHTCLTESLLTLSFRPPPKDGWVTVVYPVELYSATPDD